MEGKMVITDMSSEEDLLREIEQDNEWLGCLNQDSLEDSFEGFLEEESEIISSLVDDDWIN
tara:strand:- start:386 stop:568 length:183 start_codon:yes stop_codon:yes gene_type:complete